MENSLAPALLDVVHTPLLHWQPLARVLLAQALDQIFGCPLALRGEGDLVDALTHLLSSSQQARHLFKTFYIILNP